MHERLSVLVRNLGLAVLCAAIVPVTPVFAAEGPTVSVGGQYRPRGIVDSGRDFKESDTLQREYMSQRTRLNVDIKGGEKLNGAKFRLMLQDVRIWGEELSPVHDKSAAGLDVQEAYAILPLAGGLNLKMGRQEIIFDNHRIIGNIGWLQRAQSFDAARLFWKNSDLRIDGFWAQVVERDSHDAEGTVPPGRKGDYWLAGLHGHYSISKKAAAEGKKAKETSGVSLAYYLRNNDATKEVRHTLGGIYKIKTGGLKATAEAYMQFGDLNGESIAAQLGALHLGYTLDVAVKPSLTVFAEYLSGDGTAQSTFDTLHATNHKFYGEMDFFLAIAKHTGTLGLMDAGLKLAAGKVGPLKLLATAHNFQAVKEDADGNKDFGNELDLKMIWPVRKGLAVRALWALFVPGKAMGKLKGFAKDADLATEQFGYLTIDAKF